MTKEKIIDLLIKYSFRRIDDYSAHYTFDEINMEHFINELLAMFEQEKKEQARGIIRKVGTTNLLKKGQLFGDLTEQEKEALKVYADRIGKVLKDLAKEYGVEL